MTAMNVDARPLAALPPVKLICLPHAGGTAALYREWGRRLPPSVRVHALELPGRGARRALPVHTEWAPLIDGLLADLDGHLADANVPFAVFGHSMGSLVGLELIHAIRQRDGRSPVWFGVSGSVAPARRKVETHWLDCTYDAMVARLVERGGTPAALLNDRAFLELLLPVLRADFHLCGTHPHYAAAQKLRRAAAGVAPLACPVAVFAGRDDSATACADDLAAWSDETGGAFVEHRFDGGHFFLDDTPEPVLATVAASLADALAQVADAALSEST